MLKEQGGLRVAAVNPAAQAAGLGPGLPLSDARALQPDLKVTPAEPAKDIRALAALADWCGRYTPWTAPEAGGDAGESGGGVWLDISGCAHLFGGEADLLEDLIGRMHGLGYAARAAAADTPGAAWAVARFGMPGGQETVIVPPGGARKALADLPVAALRLSPKVVEGLTRLGLRRAGDLYDLPRGPLVTRFGESLIRRVDQALGRAGEPISPRALPPAYRARLSFAEPVGRTEDVEAAARQLLATLCRDLERDGRGARRLELLCYRVDGETLPITIGTSRPVRDADHLWRLFREHFGSIDAGFGIDVMVLGARVTEALAAEQAGLANHAGRGRRAAAGQIAPDEGPEARMSPLVDQLANRLGAANVVRLAAHESHLPERAVYAVPVLKAGRGGRRRTWGSGPVWFVNRPRPVSLFHPPQPVEAMAPVPDDPPVMFRWRRVVHRVARARMVGGGLRCKPARRGRHARLGADARLLPRRGHGRRPLLALPQRPLPARSVLRGPALVPARHLYLRKCWQWVSLRITGRGRKRTARTLYAKSNQIKSSTSTLSAPAKRRSSLIDPVRRPVSIWER